MEERSLPQIEGLLGGCAGQALRFGPLPTLGQRAEINDLHGQAQRRSDGLHRPPIHTHKGRPQGFMAVHKRVAALLQGRYVETARQAHSIGDVEQGETGEELIEAPYLFLDNGQGCPILPWSGPNGQGPAPPARPGAMPRCAG